MIVKSFFQIHFNLTHLENGVFCKRKHYWQNNRAPSNGWFRIFWFSFRLADWHSATGQFSWSGFSWFIRTWTWKYYFHNSNRQELEQKLFLKHTTSGMFHNPSNNLRRFTNVWIKLFATGKNDQKNANTAWKSWQNSSDDEQRIYSSNVSSSWKMNAMRWLSFTRK
jgi:hypothetical protein